MKTLLLICFLSSIVLGNNNDCLLGESPSCTINLNEASPMDYFNIFKMFEKYYKYRLKKEEEKTTNISENCLLGTFPHCTINLEKATPGDFYNLYRMYEEFSDNKTHCLLGSSTHCTVNTEEATSLDFYNLFRLFDKKYNFTIDFCVFGNEFFCLVDNFNIYYPKNLHAHFILDGKRYDFDIDKNDNFSSEIYHDFDKQLAAYDVLDNSGLILYFNTVLMIFSVSFLGINSR